MRIIIIAAMTADRLIGKAGGLPWHEPADLRHFKRTTMGHAVIMGRKTFDSVGQPLPGRRNIVVSHDAALKIAGADVAGSLEQALELCRRRSEEKAFIAGGAQLYAAALPLADEMILTHIDRPGLTGDVYFPSWDESRWEVIEHVQQGALRITRYATRG